MLGSAMIDDERIKLIANERVKLTATYLNGIAVAVFAVGGFAPFITTALSPAPLGSSLVPVLSVMVICWIMSGAIHWMARTPLKDMRP